MPSGDQSGSERYSHPGNRLLVTSTRSAPVAGSTTTMLLRYRSFLRVKRANTSAAPSGDQAGDPSDTPLRSGVTARPPSSLSCDWSSPPVT